MIKNVLQTLGGIQGYGILSLCLFFSVFTAALVWALTLRRSHLEAMAKLPLEDNDSQNPENTHE
jgi:hypothetical protein